MNLPQFEKYVPKRKDARNPVILEHLRIDKEQFEEAIAQWLVCRPVVMCKGIYSYQDNNISPGAIVTTEYRFETTAQH